MVRVLVTGMSATGKSTVLQALRERGYRTVDTDDDGWAYETAAPDSSGLEQLWHEDRVAAVLAEPAVVLVVGGCARNQGSFYDRLDAVVLLSLPADVLLERLATRTTNGFGRSEVERRRVLDDLEHVEPRLRATATIELDTRRPLVEVVDAVDALVQRLRSSAGPPP